MNILPQLDPEGQKKKAYLKLMYNVIKWILSFIGLYYLYINNMITEERIIIWIIIFIFIILYIFIAKVIQFIINYEFEKDFAQYSEQSGVFLLRRLSIEEKKQDKFKKLKEKWTKILKITIILSKIINPLFWILTQINVNWIFFCRWFNWKFYRFENFRKFIYFIFLYCFNYPILILYWFFYRILSSLIYESIYKLIFQRFTNLCVNSIWIWILGEEVYYFYRDQGILFIIFFLFIIYVFLILLSIYNLQIQKIKTEFDIRFIRILANRINSTILGQIIDVNYTFSFLNEFVVDDYYAYRSLGNNRMRSLLFKIVPDTILEMMNEIKYKPSFLYLAYLNNFNFYFSWNGLYFGKRFFKNEKNRELARQYEEEYFGKIKETLFMQWDILEYVFQTKDVVNWIVVDKYNWWFDYKEDIAALVGDYKNKEKYYKLISNYKNIDKKFLDFGENLETFCDKIWFNDLEYVYKFNRWEIEILEIIKEDYIDIPLNNYTLIKDERYNEYKDRFILIQNEWSNKHKNTYIF